MKKIIAALSICAIGALTACSIQDNVKGEEMEEVYIPEPLYIDAVTSGLIKALVVRIGFKDYPINNTNRNYNYYNDEYLKSLFEGKEGGFGTPYNGLSDYLNASSYGKLSISVGNIIDIQMDENIDNYVDDSGFINFFENDEFIKKLHKEIKVSDYDLNSDGCVDALYIWNLGSEISSEIGGYVWGIFGNGLLSDFAFMQTPEEYKANEAFVLDTLIHETGHLLFGFPDYYTFEGYPAEGRADIGNIMGWAGTGEMGDYDGWSKWKVKWLSKENVTNVRLSNGNTGIISLTPYDSDTAEGKKIALLNYGDGYIAVDYCAGINNNGFETTLRKTGFRFYYIEGNSVKSIYHNNDPSLAPEGIYFVPEEELGAYQLLTDNDEIVDLLPENELKTLRIFDIKTGDKPEFSYSFIDNTIIETEPDVFKSFNYEVIIADSKGNIINEGKEISYYDVTETGFVTTNPMGNSRCLVLVHDEDTNSTDTLLRVESVPEGYKKPSDIILHAEGINNYLFEVTSDSENVLVSTNSTREGYYLITVILEEGSNEDTTSPSENSTESSNESTYSEEQADVKDDNNQDMSNEDERSSEEQTENTVEKNGKKSNNEELSNEVKQPSAAAYKSSDIVSKINSVTPKSNTYQANRVVEAAKTKPAPQTSDRSNIIIWLTLVGASVGVSATAIIAKLKKKI